MPQNMLGPMMTLVNFDLEEVWYLCCCRVEEELAPYLPPNKRCYVFGILGSAAAQMIITLLPEIRVSCLAIVCFS